MAVKFSETFESGVGTWTTNKVSVSQSSTEAKNGTYSLRLNSSGSSATAARDVSLPAFGSVGDKVSFWFYINDRDDDDSGFRVGGYGMRFERETRSDAYWEYPGGSLTIGGPDETGENLSNDTWYKLEYEVISSTQVKARLYDNSETLILEETKTPSSPIGFVEDEGYFFYDADGGWEVYIDDVLVEGASSRRRAGFVSFF